VSRAPHGTQPIWADGGAPRAPLQGDARADVCVIGAGAAGLCAAYALVNAGKSVVVLDEHDVGAGESGRSTAHLTCALDTGWAELERLHGAVNLRLAAESHTVAVKRIAKVAALEDIDCGFEQVDGFAFTADGTGAGLESELAAARGAGVPVEYLERAPLDAFDTGPCLRYSRQAQLDPARWLQGLARAVAGRGGRIFAGTRAVSVEGGAHAQVLTQSGRRIRAGAVVVATNSPFNDRIAVQTQQAARRPPASRARSRRSGAPRALLWDDGKPYHYVRSHHPAVGAPLLIVGGEDHPTGRENDGERRWEILEAWARARFLTAGAVSARWSGQVLEPADGLALIGRNPLDHPNVYIATGHSGNGITYGMIAGLLLGDLIVGRPNAWADVYDPSRITPEAAAGYADAGLGAALRYTDWALPPDALTPGGIAPGGGGTALCGLRLGAVYRDPRGGTHELSAVCPHLGGRVRWNSAEKSWDCPVHGSRFDAYGRALNGPAPADLEKLG
jgi:glycine/D-amino acid oxidase-like deaminating enzyme/nitrite reductase/ring-hydroxylating ferredoxin subunit